MKLIDNSGGFWLNIIEKRIDVELAIRQYIVPNDTLTRLIAEEVISAIRGGIKHRFTVERKNGELIFNRSSMGHYKTGILQGKSPDGSLYQALTISTLNIRRSKGVSRGGKYILRETDSHILNGLHIIHQTSASRGGKSVEIGWTGENADIAWKQNHGFSTENPSFEYFGLEPKSGNEVVTVPGREFIGLSAELIDNLESLFAQF
jgi:hypothetical protein